MSPAAQVVHVFRKDVTETRWLLVAYVALVALATLHALRWMPVAGSPFGFTEVVIAIVGLVVLAIAVQSDSPSRPEAFWITRPLHPRAVAGAKGLLALGLIAVAAVGQVVAVHAFDVHGLRLLDNVLPPTAWYALLLCCGVVAAALTLDLRGFLLAVVLVPIALMLATRLVDARSWMPRGSALPCAVLAGLVVVGSLGWVYLVRDGLRAARSLALLAIILLVLANAPPRFPRRPASQVTIPVSAADSGFALEAYDPARSEDVAIALSVPAAAPGQRLELRNAIILVRLRDGRTMRFPVPGGAWPWNDEGAARVEGLGERPPFVRPVRDSVAEARRAHGGPLLAAPVSDVQRRAMRSGVVDVSLTGDVVVSTAHERWRMPLAGPGGWVRAGRRVQLDSLTTNVRDLAFVMQIDAVSDSLASRVFGPNEERYIVLETPSGRALPVTGSYRGAGNDGLVMPFSMISSARNRFSRDRSVARDTGEADAFLERPVLVAYDYQPKRRFPLRLVVPADSLIARPHPGPPVRRDRGMDSFDVGVALIP